MIQGEVYGNRITEALPFDNMFETLKMLQNKGFSLVLVSHKTRRPFVGPAYDLHKTAREWLIEQKFFNSTGLGWSKEQVFFELTKEEKIRRIISLGCKYYVDDLPEILEMLPENIFRIQFQPQKMYINRPQWPVIRSWKELPSLVQ